MILKAPWALEKHPDSPFFTEAPMAARKLAAMAVGVRPKREIISEPGEQRIPPDVFRSCLVDILAIQTKIIKDLSQQLIIKTLRYKVLA